MPEISAELISGPYAGQTGTLAFKDEPPRTLAFNLGDNDGTSGLIIPTSSSVSDKLTVVYVRVEEKPRKVLTYVDGRARSSKGVRYRYDRELSPAQALFDAADVEAKMEESARAQIESTRKLLLADAWEQARKAKRDVERVGDLVEAHKGRTVSLRGGQPQRFTGMRRDFTRDGGVVLTLDGSDVACLVDDEVLLLDERDTR